MTRGHCLLLVASLFLAQSTIPIVPQAATGGSAPGELGRLAWLAGCWQRESRGRVVEEQWMSPAADLMLGMGRTTLGDTLIEFEQTMIHRVSGVLTYSARPSRQEPTSFALKEQSDSLVVFENPDHDFPQRVIYRLKPDGSLAARIEGTVNGATRGRDFPYRRVVCPGGR